MMLGEATMPHLILETTADLPENANVPDILEALANELATYKTVASDTIKGSHVLRSVWHMGAGGPPGFAHLTIAVLSGRPLELRRRIAEGMSRVLHDHLAESLAAGEVSVTVELREMDRDTYIRS